MRVAETRNTITAQKYVQPSAYVPEPVHGSTVFASIWPGRLDAVVGMFTLLANSATVFDAPSTPFRIKFDILQVTVRFEGDFVGVQVREAHTVCGSLFGPLVQLVDVALELVAALHGRSGGKWPTLNRKNRVYRLVLGVSCETSERNARFLKCVLCSECRHNRLNPQRQKKH